MVILKYYNEKLQIAMNDWKTVYRFPKPEKLTPEIHQGNLYYRSRGSATRISYKQIKAGLRFKQICIAEDPLPF